MEWLSAHGTELGIFAPACAVFVWFIRFLIKQGETKDKVIEKLQGALIELSTETGKSLTELKLLLSLERH